jgi:hypothetical protein
MLTFCYGLHVYQSLTDTLHFPIVLYCWFSIVLRRSHLDPIFPLSFVTHCSRDAIVLVTPIVVVTLLFSFTISPAF